MAALHRIGRALERRPDPPSLRPAELHDEHVVVVEVQVEAACVRRRQVGVDLHRVIECQRQVVGQPGEVWIGVVQALEHHRVTAPVAVDHLVGRDQVVEVAVADSGSARHIAGGQRRAGRGRHGTPAVAYRGASRSFHSVSTSANLSSAVTRRRATDVGRRPRHERCRRRRSAPTGRGRPGAVPA